jgi:hypothetical protein
VNPFPFVPNPKTSPKREKEIVKNALVIIARRHSFPWRLAQRANRKEHKLHAAYWTKLLLMERKERLELPIVGRCWYRKRTGYQSSRSEERCEGRELKASSERSGCAIVEVVN